MVLSGTFVNILEEAGLENIVQELEEMDNTEINYIDISLSVPGMISFIKNDRLVTIDNDFKTNENLWTSHFFQYCFSEEVRRKHATRTKIVRFFGKFFDEKKAYKIGMQYSAVVMKDFEIETATGKDILDIYLEDNHGDSCGTMSDSCMRYDECQEWLWLYSTEDLSILYSRDERGKNIGRALLWNLDYNGETVTFMDRIYGTPMIEEVYKMHARKNGYYYKAHQTYGADDIMLNDTRIDDFDASFQLGNLHTSYPYMDTLTHINLDENKLYVMQKQNTFSLDSYEGNYMEKCRCGKIAPDMEYVELDEYEGYMCYHCLDEYRKCRINWDYLPKEEMWYCPVCKNWHSNEIKSFEHNGSTICITCKADALYRPENQTCEVCGESSNSHHEVPYNERVYLERVYTLVEVDGYYTYQYLHKPCVILVSERFSNTGYIHHSLEHLVKSGYSVAITGGSMSAGYPYTFENTFERVSEYVVEVINN